jgi:hypothetical protein
VRSSGLMADCSRSRVSFLRARSPGRSRRGRLNDILPLLIIFAVAPTTNVSASKTHRGKRPARPSGPPARFAIESGSLRPAAPRRPPAGPRAALSVGLLALIYRNMNLLDPRTRLFSSCLRIPVLLGCLQYPTPSLQAPAIAFCSMGTLSNVFHAADVTLGKGAEAPKLRDVHLAVSPFAKMPPENDGPEMRSARLLAIGKPCADLVRDRWIRSPECYPLRQQANCPFFTLAACPVERRRGGIEPLHARWREASRLLGRLTRAGRRGQAHSELARRRRRHGGCSGT